MPFINVKTNAPVPGEKREAIKSALGKAVTTLPGKSEQWLMVGIEPEYVLYFQGSDAPAAMVEVQIYGSVNSSSCDAMTGKICAILTKELDIPANRIYVSYTGIPDWGWNGGNF